MSVFGPWTPLPRGSWTVGWALPWVLGQGQVPGFLLWMRPIAEDTQHRGRHTKGDEVVWVCGCENDALLFAQTVRCWTTLKCCGSESPAALRLAIRATRRWEGHASHCLLHSVQCWTGLECCAASWLALNTSVMRAGGALGCVSSCSRRGGGGFTCGFALLSILRSLQAVYIRASPQTQGWAWPKYCLRSDDETLLCIAWSGGVRCDAGLLRSGCVVGNGPGVVWWMCAI